MNWIFSISKEKRNWYAYLGFFQTLQQYTTKIKNLHIHWKMISLIFILILLHALVSILWTKMALEIVKWGKKGSTTIMYATWLCRHHAQIWRTAKRMLEGSYPLLHAEMIILERTISKTQKQHLTIIKQNKTYTCIIYCGIYAKSNIMFLDRINVKSWNFLENSTLLLKMKWKWDLYVCGSDTLIINVQF